MNDKLYSTIKFALINYDFNTPHSFTELFNYSRQFRHGKLFKQFVRICKDMGVYSQVVRTEEGLVRMLRYDKANDKYIKGELKLTIPCTTCDGSGIQRVDAIEMDA